ncbi:MAG: sulfide/dihydroorotate dehydrogenase-like FAD/NAD-binding protein [Lachnospiraceae bacterium]|jgi:ferredoxin--NADP+ reductase|uniref:sulfide/dihydroorotate dehydrogenase-like FAD/NAD-binding protein n=1 Tax=Porcincola intestinalis TaxID=2606632 RepID=UPI0029DC9E57|nr:sulfide/dihydroorotate dehydrogenase-like FAD/NAD-binding protein [Porcincola intestinalis]MCI6239294.1 sulfide/dihydroorotate dehydrogenase-like FAD/NAD-binding protein [Lachnospiraceae bacterium]MCI6768246.1 sulfide/dihydroorotate dehydrogenase-like FAD/NAD-binding protein [Lachnospiraceae bacterium]MDY4204722.1 sulfide/dihydroorotate dehydrogenase-like FAD/NAD-binding protein [Porcincola intestinalis]MDY5331490.1 sulfide/dihydroorotate dehydrogenase-like FAD/NAD-binding protein [Porcincol
MYKILKAGNLAGPNYEMLVEAPRVAQRCLPGQFVIVKVGEEGERIPLTITDYDREKGTIELVYQPIGVSTSKLSQLHTGDRITDFVGPLGQPSELTRMSDEELKKHRFVFIGGGVGTAPIYPQAKWLHEHGVQSDVIIGAKTKDLVILEDRMKAVANVFITTDDGSYGRHGMVTKCLEDLIAEGHSYDYCVCIGPMIMMKFTCLTTKKYQIPTIVSMNPIMVDGTGMCGACRLMVDGEVKFACVDGPEFDGHKVDFDLAMKRQTLYRTQEGEAFLAWKEGKTHSGGCGQCGGDK